MVYSYNLFIPTLLWYCIIGFLFLAFMFILIKVLRRNDINGKTKTLLVLIMFSIPFIGSMIAIFFPSEKHQQ